MIQASLDVETLTRLYTESKFWAALVGGLWVAFKGINWVKDIREKDLKGLKSDISHVGIELNRQTDTIASGFTSLQTATTRELQELRSDFRTFYTAPDPLMIPVHARGPKKKASVTARSKAKAKTPAKPKGKAAK